MDNDRAARYNLALPIHYRSRGATGWSDGTTVNVSRSGALFAAAGELAPGAQIDFWMALPPTFQQELGAKILGSGVVIRTADGAAQVAVKFATYTMQRAAATPSA